MVSVFCVLVERKGIQVVSCYQGGKGEGQAGRYFKYKVVYIVYTMSKAACVSLVQKNWRGMIRRVTPSWQNAVAHCMVLIHICTFLMMEDV